jgi:hypothetical protein
MRGQDKLIAMRLAGKTPKCVSLWDFDMDTDWARWGDQPRVCVKGDPVIDMDLRFVVGLVVHIETHSPERAEEILAKCVDSGALIVAASSYPSPAVDRYGRTPSQSHIFFRHFENIHDNHHHVRIG